MRAFVTLLATDAPLITWDVTGHATIMMNIIKKIHIWNFLNKGQILNRVLMSKNKKNIQEHFNFLKQDIDFFQTRNLITKFLSKSNIRTFFFK